MNGPPNAVGSPEFWPEAYHVNPAGYDAIFALSTLFDKLRFRRAEGSGVEIIGRLMTVTYKSLRAVTTLTLNGFDADALKIARTMFEYEVIGAYIVKHPERVKDYIAFIRVSMQHDYNWLQEHAPRELDGLSEDTHEAVLAELAKIDPKFRTKRGGLKPSWREELIRDMAIDTDREYVYRSIYRWASGLIHGDITLFVSANDAIHVKPSSVWSRTALMTAHAAAISLIKTFNEQGRLGLDDEVTAAIEAYKKAWGPKAIPSDG